MSKSLGNGIDPLKVIDEYGADALRFMLATGNAPGNDMRYSDDKVKAARNFANKLWNASRFIMMNLPEDFQFAGKEIKEIPIPGDAILVSITRDTEFIIPHGSTVLLPWDRLLCLTQDDTLHLLMDARGLSSHK